MYVQKLETLPPPPGVLGSLKAGFEAVSSHVILISLPFLLDLFLWLGPRMAVNELLGPVYAASFRQIQSTMGSPEQAQQMASLQGLFTEWLQNYNLFSLASRLFTFPVGISSLLAQTMPVDTPIGLNWTSQVTSPLTLTGTVFLLVLIGWIVGALYFRWVSGAILGGRGAYVSIFHAVFQTLLLSVLWVIFLAFLSIPVTLFLLILSLISPTLASIGLFVLVLASFWLVVPFFFMPLGIFVRNQNAFRSIFSSFRMVRFTFPSSAMFVFIIFILTTGLNYLWSVPQGNSWMTLIGIAGHAFISTALLAASFVYYRDMNGWLHMVIEKLQQKDTPLPGRVR